MQVDIYQFDLEPVFSGLEETGITCREVARALRVSPAMVSKWRKGKAILPPEKQIFLTLMLAEQLERLRDLYADWGRASAAWHLIVRAELQLSMERLAEQEKRNAMLSAVAINNGARMFRVWWNAKRVVNDRVPSPTRIVRHAAGTMPA